MDRQRSADVALTALAPMVWGSTYLATTQLLPPGRPLLAATVRALPAGLVLLAATRQLPTGRWIWRAACLGVLNIGAFFTLLFVAAYRLPGGLAAIVGSVQPMIVIVFAMLLLRERARSTDLVACVLGTAGVALLVATAAARLDAVGVLAALAAATSMAAGIVLNKRWQRPVSLLAFTGWQLTGGGLLLLPIMLLVEGQPPAMTARNLVGFGYLALVGALLSYAVWLRGIERLPAVTVSLLGLVSPVVATVLGYLVLDQVFTWAQLLGAVAVFVALYLATRRPASQVAFPVTPVAGPGPAAN